MKGPVGELYQIRDGEKTALTTEKSDEYTASHHITSLTSNQLNAIPTRASNNFTLHHHHVKSLLCAVFISGRFANSVDSLQQNVKATSMHCDWAVVSSKPLPLQVAHFIDANQMDISEDASSSYSLFIQRLSNISTGYHRIWLLDEAVQLTDFDIPRFIATWELSFWPHTPPLVAHPILSPSSPFEFTSAEYWLPPDPSRHVLAVEADFLPLTSMAMETSFFRWFTAHVASPVVGSMNASSSLALASLVCKAALAFGAHKEVKYPCALIVASEAKLVADSSNAVADEGDLLSTTLTNLRNEFPSWVYWPFDEHHPPFRRQLSAKVLSPHFLDVYRAEALRLRNVSQRVEAAVAVHVTRIARNALKTHRASHLSTSIKTVLLTHTATLEEKPCQRPLTAIYPKTDADAFVVALYFPQFHRDSYNDKLWGTGFTDWENIESKPSFNRLGVPVLEPTIDLGRYDLTDRLVRKAQGCLAKQSGVDAFAYHHYWFYDGKDTAALSAPLEKLLEDGEPDLPFMLHWANHPWTNTWSGEGEEKVLQDQLFPPADSPSVYKHYAFLRRYFLHKYYVRVKGAPVFMIYMAYQRGNLPSILAKFNELARNDSLPGLHFVRSTPEVLHPTEVSSQSQGANNRGLSIWSDRDTTYQADLFYPSAPETTELPNARRIPVQCMKGDKTTRGHSHRPH